MIQHAKLQPRLLNDVQPRHGLERLQQPQKMKHAIECAALAHRSDDDDRMTAKFDAGDAEAFGPERFKLSSPVKSSGEAAVCRGHDHGAIPLDALLPRD